MMITLGTGIGGGILMNGEVIRGRFRDRRRVRSHAGGAGWAPLRMRQPRLLGAIRLRQRPRARGPLARRREQPLARDLYMERVQGDASQLTGPLVTEVAKAGDRTAIKLLAEVGDWLGVGLANLAAAFDGRLRHRRWGQRGW